MPSVAIHYQHLQGNLPVPSLIMQVCLTSMRLLCWRCSISIRPRCSLGRLWKCQSHWFCCYQRRRPRIRFQFQHLSQSNLIRQCAATEIVTIGNTTCGTRCSYSLDNNPAIQLVRNSGGAPQPGKYNRRYLRDGGTSACPTGTCVNYGNISNWVGNSTAGAIQSAWLCKLLNTSGTLTGGCMGGSGRVFELWRGAVCCHSHQRHGHRYVQCRAAWMLLSWIYQLCKRRRDLSERVRTAYSLDHHGQHNHFVIWRGRRWINITPTGARLLLVWEGFSRPASPNNGFWYFQCKAQQLCYRS